MRTERIKRITFLALMTAASVALSFAESLIPVASFMLPGSKLGLSNIVVMFAASALGFWPTFFIVVAKALFAAVTRGVSAGLMSLAGGLLSAGCLLLIFRKLKFIGSIGTGVISALMHNAGQLAVSFIMLQSPAVMGYIPVLILASVGTGILTGTLFRVGEPYLNKLKTDITRGKKL